MAHEERIPPRQQPSVLLSDGASGIRSTTTGSGKQQCGFWPVEGLQPPCFVATAPAIDKIFSPLAHVHPSFQPGCST